jgi:hypothetical protein
MRYFKWIGLGAAVILIASCFSPWVFIESKNSLISGVDTSGTGFGKPGYIHFALTFLFLVFTFTSKVWAKRSNLLITALNLAWAIRNYLIVSACYMGECPVRKTALYLLIPASVLMLLTALFPDITLNPEKKS